MEIKPEVHTCTQCEKEFTEKPYIEWQKVIVCSRICYLSWRKDSTPVRTHQYLAH